MTAELLAERFHNTYERLAPEHGYETRKDSAVPWESVPEKNKSLMIAVCKELLANTQELTIDELTERFYLVRGQRDRLLFAAESAVKRIRQRLVNPSPLDLEVVEKLEEAINLTRQLGPEAR